MAATLAQAATPRKTARSCASNHDNQEVTGYVTDTNYAATQGVSATAIKDLESR